jgi:hypothetical protein
VHLHSGVFVLEGIVERGMALSSCSTGGVILPRLVERGKGA